MRRFNHRFRNLVANLMRCPFLSLFRTRAPLDFPRLDLLCYPAILNHVRQRAGLAIGAPDADRVAGTISSEVGDLMAEPVDAVILWVAMDDRLVAEIDRWQALEGIAKRIDPSRYRNNNEIVYSVAAIRRFMPWVRNIYVVTNGQWPPDSVLAVEGVTLVTHDDFFLSKAHLPTFNSNAIEANAGFIEGLAERFILFNDDFFVGHDLDVSAFFDQDGTPILKMERHLIPPTVAPDDMYGRALLHTDRLLTEKFGPGTRQFVTHTPFALTRTLHFSLWTEFLLDFQITSASKFRDPKNILFLFLAAYSLLWKKTLQTHVDEKMGIYFVKYPTRMDYVFVRVGQDGTPWRDSLDYIIEQRPAFFCLNDHIGADRSDKDGPVLEEFLREFGRYVNS